MPEIDPNNEYATAEAALADFIGSPVCVRETAEGWPNRPAVRGLVIWLGLTDPPQLNDDFGDFLINAPLSDADAPPPDPDPDPVPDPDPDPDPVTSKVAWLGEDESEIYGLDTMFTADDGSGDPVEVGDLVGFAGGGIGPDLVQATSSAKPIIAGTVDAYGVEFGRDSTAQYLVADVPSGLAEATEFTFACQFKPGAALTPDNSNTPVFMVTVNGGSTTDSFGISIRLVSGNNRLTLTGPGQSSTSNEASSVYEFDQNEWVPLAGTLSSDNTLRLYADGLEVATGTFAGGVPADLSAYRVSIGAARDGARRIEGQFSDLMIWDRALTASEVSEISTSRTDVSTPPSGLLFYKPM